MSDQPTNGAPGQAHDSRETRRQRRAMVRRLQERGAVQDPAVIAAMSQIPRHVFLPGLSAREAYADQPQATLRDGTTLLSSVSQPTMIAQMLEHGHFAPGHRVLEVGTGQGYNAALLGHIVGPTGRVVTVDVEPSLVAFAAGALDELGLGDRVSIRVADGRQPVDSERPFDRIIVTAGAEDVAPSWPRQLQEGGLLIVPLSAPRECVVWAKTGGGLAERVRLPARFIPLRDPVPGSEE
ncbi:protein-L-isoaspartate O-methyltransferase family protein [Euzebya tangerina]|uniref:protein-L-isoaspartate O-methyltransferase family protein n=1 Tax=Euzebya tangerina TaxID=591198 RepID=UPI0013C2D8B3|nr:methyltransferase domain-containing protein [Euzebya tangerina]